MKKLGCFAGAMCLALGIASAQDLEKKTQTKVSVEDGKTITVTGCVQRGNDGELMLTNVANKDGALGSYLLAADDDDLDKHVGHRVEIKGKATDGRDGKVKIESETKTSGNDKVREKTELEGDVHALGVKSVKMIASSCR